jgi:hypothetical protein
MTFNTLQEATSYWADEPEKHVTIFKDFFRLVESDPELKSHRDFVEQNEFGYGDRPFHWMWNLIVKDLPENFKFLEIGVYQGQVISLVSFLSKRYGKNGSVFGLTPLSNVDDAFSKHHNVNYEERIATLYQTFGLDASDLTIIEGLSNDAEPIRKSLKEGPYDCVYIDGGHDYDTVTSDISIFGPQVKSGGLLVMDDSANFLQIPDGLIRMNWRGLESVSKAVRDHLETNSEFTEILSVGHNRVWRRS